MTAGQTAIVETNLEGLRERALRLPSQGGVEIGPWLEGYAAEVPRNSSIVEIGCWLGAGTAFLALGAMAKATEIHVYDRWRVVGDEAEKARRWKIKLRDGEDTLPLVKRFLSPFPALIRYHKGDVRQAIWSNGPIGLYVDDATKVELIWEHAVRTFFPSFIRGETILVLMDYHFDEKAGPKYGAQKRWMAAHRNRFELIEERMGGTTAAAFRYVG